MLKIIICISLLILPLLGLGQKTLSGKITDENNIPIPFAEIYAKNAASLRTMANNEGYYEMQLMPGEYFLVFRALGFDDREAYVTVDNNDVVQNIQLFSSDFQEVGDVNVSAKKSNPGREIMLKVVAKKDTISFWNYPHSCDVYIRATEKQLFEEDKKKEKSKDEAPVDPAGIEDPFEKERLANDKLANGMNLVEVKMERYSMPPNKVKEIRKAYEKRGSDRDLYYLTTVKSSFNFFENLMHLDDLHQTPVLSPISVPGILSYKYRLVDQYEENGRKIHKIKIIPRSSSTSTLEGYIWVIDSIFLVQKIELTMEKGNLLIYDYFKIEQTFDHPGDSICILKEQNLSYGVKYNKEIAECKTLAKFSNYEFNTDFEKKFFSNALAITDKDAYDKDTAFWGAARSVELSAEEKEYIRVKDSITAWHSRKEYTDSIDAIFNEITILKVLWFGVDHRNRVKKTQWTINSLAGTIRPLYIAGPRIAPGFYYFKKWDNEKALDIYSELSVGLLNKDLKGTTWWRYRYDPFHFGTIGFQFGHNFDLIRSFDAITQIFNRQNFIETTSLELMHSIELVNGLYLNSNLEFSERRSVDDYKFLNVFDDLYENNDPLEFETYQATIATWNLSYTPAQKYMLEPKRKVILGSKFPTFYLEYEKGIPVIFGSDVNHDYLEAGIQQNFKLWTFGTSNYHIKSGKFLNTKSLKDADFRYHRRSDPIWFSNPLYSFQNLDTTLPSRKIYYEAHFVHHDNGAILNKIPFMKKTGIGLVFGAGALYVTEFDWLHYESYIGLERNFKLSRRRLRIGIYGVFTDGNNIKPISSFKISFAILDNRDLKWNF